MILPQSDFLRTNNFEWLIWRNPNEWVVRNLLYEVRAVLPGYPLRVSEYIKFGNAVSIEELNGNSLVLYNGDDEELIVPRKNNVN